MALTILIGGSNCTDSIERKSLSIADNINDEVDACNFTTDIQGWEGKAIAISESLNDNIVNGGFEDNLTNWLAFTETNFIIEISTTNFYSGSKSCHLEYNGIGGNGVLEQDYSNITSNMIYNYSFWAKYISGDSNIFSIFFYDTNWDSGYTDIAIINSNSDWFQITSNILSLPNSVYSSIDFYIGNAGGEYYIDDVKFLAPSNIFGGIIQSSSEYYKNMDTFTIPYFAIDYSHYLKRKLINKRYQNTKANNIIADILTNYFSGIFTTTNIDSGPALTINFNYCNGFDAISKVANNAGYNWYVDPNRSIHFFSNSLNPAPENLDDNQTNYSELIVNRSIAEVKNKIVYRGGYRLSDDTNQQIIIADGEQRAFNLDYKPHSNQVFEFGPVWKNYFQLSTYNKDSNSISNLNVQLAIPYQTNMNPDFSDIRFCYSLTNHTNIPYMRYGYVEKQGAVFDLKLQNLTANDSNNFFCFFNSPLTRLRNEPTNTYIFYDDFEDKLLYTELFSNIINPLYGEVAIGYEAGYVEISPNNSKSLLRKYSIDGVWILPITNYGYNCYLEIDKYNGNFEKDDIDNYWKQGTCISWYNGVYYRGLYVYLGQSNLFKYYDNRPGTATTSNFIDSNLSWQTNQFYNYRIAWDYRYNSNADWELRLKGLSYDLPTLYNTNNIPLWEVDFYLADVGVTNLLSPCYIDNIRLGYYSSAGYSNSAIGTVYDTNAYLELSGTGEKTVGVANVSDPTSNDYYVSYWDKTMYCGTNTATPKAGSVMNFCYKYEIPIEINRENTNSINWVLSNEGTTTDGRYEHYIYDESIEHQAYASNMVDYNLAEYSNLQTTGSFKTNVLGYHSGQQVHISSTRRNISNDFTIDHCITKFSGIGLSGTNIYETYIRFRKSKDYNLFNFLSDIYKKDKARKYWEEGGEEVLG